MDSDKQAEFYTRLTAEILSGMSQLYSADNWDTERFGTCSDAISEVLLRGLNQFFRITGRRVSPVQTFYIQTRFAALKPYLPALSGTYSLLLDEYSQSLFIRLVAYRMLGFHHIKLPLAENIENYSLQKKKIQTLIDDNVPGIKTLQNIALNVFDLDKIGYPIRCYSNQNLVLPIFLLKQYEYHNNTTVIAPSEGDYIIDAGAGWGDSALFFSYAAGPQGKIFSFEFEPENLAIMEKNFLLNQKLAARVEIIPHALWNKPEEIQHYSADGMATAILQGANKRSSPQNQTISTLSIDDFIEKKNPGRLDFIKMDIEGAELKALQGAAQTIQRYHPTLAIALYHNLGDFWELPHEVHRICPDYALFLGHFTIHEEETILFAIHKEKMARKQ